ncbi:hypothetical protein N9K91_06300 [Schleiferiaceae bacterium]|nr:hypothetical protein [Schleiferiaceae bacterium]
MTKKRFTLTPKFLRGYLQVFREKGIKEGIKAVGLRVAIGMFLFFLIKGMVLYILLPYLIATGAFSG